MNPRKTPVRRTSFVIVLTVLLWSLGACATEGNGDATTIPSGQTSVGTGDTVADTTDQTDSPDVWKYGTIQAMTGFGAHWGDQQSKAHIMATEQLNESGEFPFTIEVVVGDHRSDDPTAATSAAQRMIEVDDIQWFNSSWVASTLATNPILFDAGIPAINAVGTGEGLTGHPWLYNLRLQASQVAPYVVKFVAENNNIEKAAFAWWSDAHAVMGEQQVAMAEDLGIEVTVAEAFEPNTTDFRSLLARIAASEPDAIFLSAFGADVGHFVSQAREIGLFPGTIIAGNIVEQASYDVAGDALDGFIYAQSLWWPGLDTTLNRQFIESYTERWGIEESTIESAAAMEYEAAMVMRDVLRYVLANGGDPFNGEDLNAALLEIDGFATIHSDDSLMQIREDGSVVKPLHFIRAGTSMADFEVLGEIADPIPLD
jgi:branched-chain amino acid transport system substrate-binding protein